MCKKVIIDSDIGWDDVLSIAYLMKDPDIEIIGIAVTGCGETNLRWGTTIAQQLLGIGNQKANVAVGTETPLKYKHVFPQSFKNDMNDIMGLLGSLNPVSVPAIADNPAWQFIYDTLKNSKGKVTILSLGGFTNLAKMLELNPEPAVLGKIERIYAMAGAVYVDGNVAALNNAKPEWNQGPIYSTNYHAEWNIFVDPLATSNVFKSDIPITLVPLDACNYVLLDADFVKRITATDPIATLVKGIFLQKSGSHNEGISVPIFDPLATLIMSGKMTSCQSRDEFLEVDLHESQENNKCGKISVASSGSRKITFVQGVSQKEFGDIFAKIINS
jgi:inosine-uridine nucleoside N-ribohydrolase